MVEWLLSQMQSIQRSTPCEVPLRYKKVHCGRSFRTATVLSVCYLYLLAMRPPNANDQSFGILGGRKTFSKLANPG